MDELKEVEIEVKEKPKRVMSEEAQKKLALAREKANQKRKEMAEARKEQIEEKVQEKMAAHQEIKEKKICQSAEKIIKKRVTELAPKNPPTTKPKKSRESIVIEREDSDSSEDDVRDARVYFVRKNKGESVTPPTPTPPPVPAPHLAPDPLDGIYKKLFGGSNYMW